MNALMCPTEPRTHDVHALHRDAAARRGVAADHEQAAAAGGARRLARVAVDDDGPGHHVLGHPDAAVAVHAHGGVLVHAGAVVAHVAVDLDLDRRVDAGRQRVRPARVEHAPAPRPVAVDGACSAGVQLAQGVTARSTVLTVDVVPGSSDRRPLPAVDAAGLGLPDRRLLGAGQHGDRAVLGRHRHPVVGLGHHGRLAGDRVAQDGEAVGRADREGVEAVEVVEAALERLLERRRPRAAAR